MRARPTPGRARVTCSERCRKRRARRMRAAVAAVLVALLVVLLGSGCGDDYRAFDQPAPPAPPPCWYDAEYGLAFCTGPASHAEAEQACDDQGSTLADPSDPDDPAGIDPDEWGAVADGAAELGPRVWTGWPPVTPDGWTGCAVWLTSADGHPGASPGDCGERLPFVCERWP